LGSRPNSVSQNQGLEGAKHPPQKICVLFDLKTEHIGVVFKLDLTEETRTQLQEESSIASSCLILAAPMDPMKYPFTVQYFGIALVEIS